MGAARTGSLQDDRFLVLEAVGRGGMGAVYRAFDRVDERMVALKVLDDDERPGPAHPLSAEYEHWARLRHPNVVRAYALRRARNGPFGEGKPYLVVEYFAGVPVHRALRPGRCDAATLEELARRVLHGLRHVHEAGLVHRDLKAGNVLVGPSRAGPGRVKLTDFGLAEPAGTRCEPGRLTGSLPYVAPETMLGGRLDGRSDLYGLGMLLFFLATGRMAAPSRDPERIVRWHLEGSTPDPRELRPDLSLRLVRFIRRLTARDLDERPAGADDALLLLGGVPPPPVARRRDVDRGEIARLRLALDAVRLGARRALDLPLDRPTRDAVVQLARRLAHVHGLDHQWLGPARGRGAGSLERLVASRLCEHGERAPRLIARHRLDRFLPFALLDGTAIRDRAREQLADEVRHGAVRAAAAERLAVFLLDSSDDHPLVLQVARCAAADPLVRDMLARLRRVIEASPAPRPHRGGLLLLLDPGR